MQSVNITGEPSEPWVTGDFCEGYPFVWVNGQHLTEKVWICSECQCASSNNDNNDSYDKKSYQGFPIRYAGYESKAELLTTATESLFYATYPEYFDSTKDNADKIRYWAYSYWLLLAKHGNEKNKKRKKILEEHNNQQ